MDNETNSPIIFYLILDEALPKTFYILDSIFKDMGLILVPVKIDQLQMIASTTIQNNLLVISSATDSAEYRRYNEKVRGLLKYILKSKRLTFMQLSSFSKLNDTKFHALTKNYFFLKYPLDARVLAAQIARYLDLKSEQKSRWPGGRRAGLGSMAA